MIFVVMAVFLWAVALFHIWDHRCFERDLRHYRDGRAGLDWRVVCPQRGNAVFLKRAFVVDTREARLRYGVPVLVFTLCLLLFKSWLAAGLYALAMIGKWFVATTVFDTVAGQYRVMVSRWTVFTARLD